MANRTFNAFPKFLDTNASFGRPGRSLDFPPSSLIPIRQAPRPIAPILTGVGQPANVLLPETEAADVQSPVEQSAESMDLDVDLLPDYRHAVLLIEAGRAQCRYPLWKDDEPRFCCGAPTDGRSYCQSHGEICGYSGRFAADRPAAAIHHPVFPERIGAQPIDNPSTSRELHVQPHIEDSGRMARGVMDHETVFSIRPLNETWLVPPEQWFQPGSLRAALCEMLLRGTTVEELCDRYEWPRRLARDYIRTIGKLIARRGAQLVP